MACSNKTASNGDKGVGTLVFFDGSSCTHVADPDADPLTLDVATDNAYTKLDCVTEVTPPGVSRSEESDDGCLETDGVIKTLGPAELKSSSLTIRNKPGDAVDVALRAAIKNNSSISIVIKHPTGSTFMYEWYDAQVSDYSPSSITKRGFREVTMQMTPQTWSGFTDTAADLGTGLS